MVQDPAAGRADLLNRARQLVPVLRDRAPEAERLRRMPDETVADFRAADFYRALQPARYGGLELPFGVHTEFSVELVARDHHRVPRMGRRHVPAGCARGTVG